MSHTLSCYDVTVTYCTTYLLYVIIRATSHLPRFMGMTHPHQHWTWDSNPVGKLSDKTDRNLLFLPQYDILVNTIDIIENREN